MSFLSSLFCCSEGGTERHESTITPKLTQTQSNIQKALSRNTSNSNISVSKNQKQQVIKKAPSSKSIRSDSSNLNTNSKDNTNKTKRRPKSTSGKEEVNKHNNNSKTHIEQHKRNMTDSTLDSIPLGTQGIDKDLKSQNVREITDLKDATDSSRDDETINNNKSSVSNNNKNGNNDPTLEGTNTTNFGNSDLDIQEKDVDMGDYDDEDLEEDISYDDDEDEEDEDMSYNDELDLTRIQTEQARSSETGWLLDSIKPEFKNKKCLVLDLDETLVHSSFKYVRHFDFVIPVDIDNQIHNVYVIKRPGVDEFLKRCGELFEVVVFTASVARYGDPLLDILDGNKSVHHRLFRDSCYNYQGNYVKNLSQMGRPLENLIIIDNSPASYIFHPQHSVPISSWFSDTHDCELSDLLPFLEDLANEKVDDVSLVLDVNI